jgi:RNA polymerase sigma factor (sigma-70 family)
LDRATLERQFDHLLAANGPALTRLAASYTNTSSDRDDLLQEIAIAVWKALPQFRGECSDRTFLFRVAHNRGVAFLLRNRSRMSGALEEIEVRDPARRIQNQGWHKSSGWSASNGRSVACRSATGK